MATEAKIRANAKYDKANTQQILLKLNKKTDADILEVINAQDNKQGFLKECIREYMKRHK